MHSPFLIAHRGDRVNFPENSIEGFESAFSKGADGIELDVQLKADELILVHNYFIDPNIKYPTLQQVFDKFKSQGRIEIEIKSFSEDILNPLRQIIEQNGVINFELTSSVLPLISQMRLKFPTASIGAIFTAADFEPWMDEKFIERKVIELMTLMNANIAHVGQLPIDHLTQNFVESLHANNIKVHGHIKKIDMKQQIKSYMNLKNLGVDQCTFDDIHLLNEVTD